jgi:hypothetical protein
MSRVCAAVQSALPNAKTDLIEALKFVAELFDRETHRALDGTS